MKILNVFKDNIKSIVLCLLLSVFFSLALSYYYINQLSIKSSTAIFLINDKAKDANFSLSNLSLGFGASASSKNEKMLYALFDSPGFHFMVLSDEYVASLLSNEYPDLLSFNYVQKSTIFKNTFQVSKNERYGYFTFTAKSNDITVAAKLSNHVLSILASEISDVERRESERYLEALNISLDSVQNVELVSRLIQFYQEKNFEKILGTLGETSILQVISEAVPFERRAWPSLRYVTPFFFVFSFVFFYLTLSIVFKRKL